MTRLRVSRVGRDPSHRKHMFRTMVTQLFKHERIKTTLPKKCGFRKFDKAPMAYIELVDSPKEIGKRIEKRPKVYPTIEELREKAPTMDIYNKPVVHVSESKRTSLLGGMVTLLNRLRTIPIPTVSDLASNLLTPPDLSVEFANVPGPGQPREKEFQEKIEKSEQAVKKQAQEVLERRKIERKEERAHMRKLLHMDGSRKQRKAAAAAARATQEGKGEGEGEGSKEGEKEGVEKMKATAGGEGGNKPIEQASQPGNKPQGSQQHKYKAYHNKNKKHNKRK